MEHDMSTLHAFPHAPHAWSRLPPQHLQAGDAQLAFRISGQGPALMLVHGFPLHGATWRRVLPLLSARHTCIVVDLAGCGDSEWDARTDFGFQAHARRLQALADELALPAYAVLAHDTGGTVARCLALADARVQALALINTEMPGHRPPWVRLYQQTLGWPGADRVLRTLLRWPAFVRSPTGFGGAFCDLGLLAPGGEVFETFVRPLIRSPRRAEGVIRYLRGISWEVVDAMAGVHPRLRMPVQLVWGEDDPTFPIRLAREMAQQFADGRGLVAIAGTRLLPHEERPAEVAQAVLDFLASVAAPSALGARR
jgi:haloalkane dehalogenase